MTPSETDRIMSAVDAVRGELRGLRVDFNGRLRGLELWRAEMKGRMEGAGGTKAGFALIIGLALNATGIVAVLAVALLR